MLLSGAAVADDNAYCSRPLRAALFEYGVLYRSALKDGADSRLLELLERRTGCQVEMVVLPRTRVWAEMKAGQLDIATAVISTPERESYAYILPYLKTRNVVLINKSATPSTTTASEFEAAGLRMGAVRGFRHEPFYDALLDRIRQRERVLEAVDVQENLRYLQRGMVDAVLSQPIVYRAYFNDNQLRDTIVIQDWAPQQEVAIGGLMLSRSTFTEAQARRWEKLLETLKNDGSQVKTLLPFMPAAEARDLVYTGPRRFDADAASK